MDKQISKSELEVMEIIWHTNRPTATKEIMDALNEKGKNIKSQTLNTFLLRLEKKGAVSREQGYVEAVWKKEDYMQKQSRGILDSMYGGRLGYFVSSLAGSVGISRQDAEELKKIIEQYDGTGKKP